MTGWKDKAGKLSEQEVRETIQAAHKALSDIAHTKGLDPNGERARDLCGAALVKLSNGRNRTRSR